MEWLNYHHLLYFWLVVREGGVTRAAEKLHLSHPTVSTQIKQLERALGEKLLEKKGRRLVPTEVGQIAYRYADEIFGLGHELLDTVKGANLGGSPDGVMLVLDLNFAYNPSCAYDPAWSCPLRPTPGKPASKWFERSCRNFPPRPHPGATTPHRQPSSNR